MRIVPRFFVAALLGGISLSMAVGLLAASAWLISMASTQPPILTLQVAVVSVRFFGLGRGVFRYAERIYGHDAILRAATALQIRIYGALLRREPMSSQAMRQGKLLQQLTADIELVQDRWIRIFIPGISAAIAAWAGVGVIFWLAPDISFIVLAIYLITAILIVLLSAGVSKQHSREIFENESALADLISDTTRGHLEAKIYGYQDALRASLGSGEAAIIRGEKRLISNAGGSASILQSGMYGAILVSFLMALPKLENGLAGINLAVVTLLPLAIFDGLAVLIAPLANYGKIVTAQKSIDDVIKSATATKAYATLEPGTVMLKAVSARGVWKSKSLSHNPVSLNIRAGESLLLQGESGIGKSSLALAISGLINYEGSIRINGIEVRDIRNENLRNAMTVSLQEDHLFASSIFENMKLANPDASDGDIAAALKAVELDELINSIPEKMDTHIGAFGKNFSGGELQRMRLARVFLRKTPLYILDEPLEHLDKQLAERIFQRLQKHMAGATVIVISHEKIAGIENRLLVTPAI
ncbi:MAG: thiol reductant ABC exporter subunit CydC [Candidatus Nanopelagicaceae bacterium]|nr:thiol reductant ABC exporter subunit CydC [Candidatus Nanopelagicaceae bacterium]